MEITRVKIDKYTPKKQGVCAIVTVYLDNELAIHQIHVCNGKKGIFVTFPNTGETKVKNGSKRYEDIVHPCKNDLRLKITDAILDAYNDYIGELE